MATDPLANPYDPTLQPHSPIHESSLSRRWWIIALLCAEVYWHGQLLYWAAPPPNTWDMGGVAAKIQLLILHGGIITLLLIGGIARGIKTSRLFLALISSISAAAILILTLMRLNGRDLVFPVSHIFFNSIVSIVLLVVPQFRSDFKADERTISGDYNTPDYPQTGIEKAKNVSNRYIERTSYTSDPDEIT